VGQTIDDLPWWLTMIAVWVVLIGLVAGVIGGAAWLIVWMIGVWV
jgi:hypothetical protein